MNSSSKAFSVLVIVVSVSLAFCIEHKAGIFACGFFSGMHLLALARSK